MVMLSGDAVLSGADDAYADSRPATIRQCGLSELTRAWQLCSLERTE